MTGNGRHSTVLREERKDRGTRVTTNDWDGDALDVGTCDLMPELVAAHDVQSGGPNNLVGFQAFLHLELRHQRVANHAHGQHRFRQVASRRHREGW